MQNKKKVEWKETNTFLFSPKYEYSLAVRNRCVFFGCTGNRYRRMINWAKYFAHSSRICVIYVYGDIGRKETLEKYMKNAGINTLVLHLPGVQQDIDTFLRVEKFLLDLKTQGLLKVLEVGRRKSQYSNTIVGRVYASQPGDFWYKERDAIYKAVSNGYDTNDSMYLRYRHEDKLWNEDRPAALSKINTALDMGYVAYGIASGTISGRADEHNAALLNIIQSIYPYGIEADTKNEYAYKMAASNKIVQLTVDGKYNDNAVLNLGVKLDEIQYQMSLFPDFTIGATEAVRILREWCEKQIQHKHSFRIGDVWRIFENPPFGAYRCNWYLYLFAFVLRSYNSSRYFIAQGYFSKRIEPQDNFSNLIISAGGTIYAQNEAQNRFMHLMYKMFDTTVPIDGTTHRAISVARSWITEHVHYMPVAVIDGKWAEVLCWREDDYWQESGYEDEYLPWLEANFDQFYAAICTIDADFRKRLAEEYGTEKADLYCKYYYVKGGAIGWLHNPNDTRERVEEYMNKEICRECGAPLVINGLNAYHGYNGEKFTIKDIIGLNKKMLGRYQNEYFCIRCLCDVIEQTETQLYEKLHEFREAGCQLFG